MKKIGIITSGALPIPAAKGGAVETLIQILLEENEKSKDFLFSVFTISDNSAIANQNTYKCANFINIKDNPLIKKITLKLNTYIYALNRRTFKNPSFCLKLPFDKWILKNGCLKEFDLILVESNFNIIPFLKRYGAKKIVYHSHYNDVNPDISDFKKKIYRFGYSFVDANISVSKFIDNNIKNVINSNSEFKVVENCTKKFDLIDDTFKNQIAEEYNIPKDKTIIMYSGRLTPEKGVAQLIKAFKQLDDINNISLVVAGGAFYSDNSQNEYVKKLKNIASECKNPVIFTGFVEHKKMLKLLQLADLAVIPTYDVEEAGGLVVIEALKAKVPIIHTDSGGMSEYSSPECAVVVTRGEDFENRLAAEIEKLCKYPEKLLNMSEAAFARSNNWSIDNYYTKFKDFLHSLLR